MARTPETLTATQRAAEIGMADGKPAVAGSGPVPVAPKNEKYLQQARASLTLALPVRSATPQAPAKLDPRGDVNDSFALLSIDDIEPYANNPRIGLNPRHDEIKASMRADGMTNALTVTRKPGALKYHPYGGGNTRLQIARELHEEGDPRFSKLNVIVKEWRGDAHVISAHLAENELRGDISFWEKAKGVSLLQVELQRDSGKVVTAAELNKTLKANGINFGIRTVQNFFFAMEHLAPVGPWLQSRAVNDAIRPAVSAAKSVVERLGSDFKSVASSTIARLASYLTDLEERNQAVDPGDQKPVILDPGRLIEEVYQACASHLGVSDESFALMVSAVEADSQIRSDALRNIGTQPSAKAAAADKVATPATVTRPPSDQRSLAGMLAAVPSGKKSDQDPLSQQRVRGLSESGINPPPNASDASDGAPQPDPLTALSPLLVELSDLVCLQDVLLQAPHMPFGFLVDLPRSLQEVNGQPVPYPSLRAAAWKLLAGLSYQLSPQFLAHLGPEQSTWVAALQRGPALFRREFGSVFDGRCDELGNPEMGMGELQLLFAQPQLSKALTALMVAMEDIRVACPERFVPPNVQP